jgi:hypothetical protein
MKKEIIFGLLFVGLVIFGIFFVVNYSDYEHEHDDEHSVEIEGKDLKLLSVQEVADLWEIDSKVFLSNIITEFDLKESYDVDFVLDDMREEYSFSPALIKDMAEEIKQQGLPNE